MIEYVSSPIQILSAFAVWAFGGCIGLLVAHHFRASYSRAFSLYLWHSLFCIFYLGYVLEFGGDATEYFDSSFSSDLSLELGTGAVRFMVSIFSQVLGLSLLGCTLAFQIFGYLGLLAFDASLREVTWHKALGVRMLATLIVFLPSISFWSSGLGKDPISFLAMGLALWASLDMKSRSWILVISVIVMLAVRPHMAGMLALGFAVSFVVQKGIPLPQRVFMGVAGVCASVILVPFGLNYAGLSEGAGGAELAQYIETRQGYNTSGGGAVDISGMNPAMQMFTYLFRPALLESRSVFSLAAAVDNLILLGLAVVGGIVLAIRPLPVHLQQHNRMFLWAYCIGAWVVLAMTTSNLGIALRQKWMFAPMLMFLWISVLGRSRKSCQGGN